MIWIHFSKSSHGSYGGGLKEPFRYFGRVISDKFKKEAIELPFKEIEIQLAFFSLKAQKMKLMLSGTKSYRIITVEKQ